jgi:transcription elongation GreA/GreB family factor|tara:strand:+ start:72 stop:518 length:447 start_codon:yes stop_codon:yes gene_type:complete
MLKKEAVISAIQESIGEQIGDYILELNSVNEEIGKETKSSAGDKFETSREMMNQEVSRLEERIAYLKKQLNSLQQLSQRKSSSIENGSLVNTNHGVFFFGIAFGKLESQGSTIMGLSLNSPLGKIMTDKKEGDSLTFMNRNYSIETIY